MRFNYTNQFAILLLIAFCIYFYSCNSNKSRNQLESINTSHDSIRPEKSFHQFDKTLANQIITSVNKYSSDTTQSYEVYLPSDYDTLKSFPLVIFFDAHARGKLPLKKYLALSEKYHFVFVSSNNSQNGMSLPETQKIASVILKDATARFNINGNLIFTSGFSGGAKVACTFAFTNSAIRGVIACASPFSERISEIKNMPQIFLLSGNKDFNMLSMVQTDLELSDAGFTHQLYVYDGIHDWPDEKYFEIAMKWLITKAVNQNLIEKKNQPNEIPDFNEWYNTRVTDAVILKQEAAEQQALNDQFQIWDIPKWNDKIKELKAKEKSGFPSSIRFLASRELNYISMLGFIYSENFLNQNNLKTAKHFLEIYELANAKNPDVWFLKAVYYSKSGDNKATFDCLKKSAQLGFSDVNRLKNENSFSSFTKTIEYQNLVFKIVLLNSEKY